MSFTNSGVVFDFSLEILGFQSNLLEGTIPSTIFDLSSLSIFGFSNNTRMGGTISTDILKLTQLTRFEASNTQLSGTIPDAMYQLPRLADIVVRNASMSGPLKEDISARHATLRQLELESNSFTGALPTALDVLTAMETLLLEDNMFTGTISDTVCDERGLGFMNLYRLRADCNIECNCNDACP